MFRISVLASPKLISRKDFPPTTRCYGPAIASNAQIFGLSLTSSDLQNVRCYEFRVFPSCHWPLLLATWMIWWIQTGLEPATSCVQDRHSPNWITDPLVGKEGFEPTMPEGDGVTDRCLYRWDVSPVSYIQYSRTIQNVKINFVGPLGFEPRVRQVKSLLH